MGSQPPFWTRIFRFCRRSFARDFQDVGKFGLDVDFGICGQSNEIPSDSRLMRRFIDSPNHLEWDSDSNRYIPAAKQLQFDPDMSTQWAEHLALKHKLGPEAVLDGNSSYSLVGEWKVDTVLKSQFLVSNTPDLTRTGPLSCSHTSIDWPTSSIVPPKEEPSPKARRKLRSELTREMVWIFGDITTAPPERS